ncbi:hypothetical protein CHUAL_005169 [Chamberlinius hualienensis]
MTQCLCPSCSLNDSIVLINPAYLQLIDVHDNPLYYYMSLIARQAQKSLINISHQFDNWILTGDTDFKQIILADKQRRNVSPSNYIQIDHVFNNYTTFGGDILLQKRQWKKCKIYYETVTLPLKDSISLSIANPVNTPSTDIVQMNTTSKIINTINRILATESTSTFGPLKNRPKTQKQQNFTIPKCGLLFYLIQLAATSLVNWLLIRPILSSFLCQDNDTVSCFLDDVNQTNNSNISTAYVAALVYYTVDYLPKNVLMQQTKSIAITKSNIESVALGYYVEADNLRPLNISEKDVNVHHVKGFVEHYKTEEEAELYAPLITLKTCLLNKSRDDNLKYKAVDGVQRQMVARDDGLKVVIDGYEDYKIHPANVVQPCVTAAPFYKNLQIYLSHLSTAGNFSFISNVQYKSNTLQRFVMQIDQKADLLSTDDVTGYASWVTLGEFESESNSAVEYQQVLNTTSENSAQSEVLIEPVTGKVWVIVSSASVYVGLKMFNYTSNYTHVALNKLVGKPIPFYSVYSKSEPSDLTVARYNSEIRLLLQMSCGGLIGLSIVGSVIILTGIGVAIAVLDRPPHRVSPAQDNYVNMNNEINTISRNT